MGSLNFTALVKALALNCVLLFLFFLYGSRNFYRDPGSIFYDDERGLERRYSLLREREALAFRDAVLRRAKGNAAQNSTALQGKVGDEPLLCAMMITVARTTEGGGHPLELSLSSALMNLSPPERNDLDFRLYFANTDPSIHPLWDSPLLDLADRLVTIDDATTRDEREKLVELEKDGDLGKKTGLDFSNALDQCYRNTSSPYIAVFEGDILFANGWFARAQVGLGEIEERVRTTHETWLDMRLFNEERSVGWADNRFLGNNVPFIAAGIAIVLVGTHLVLARFFKRTFISNQTLTIICCVSVPLFVIFFFQAGKSSVLPPRPGVKLQNWGCCTQGLILPRSQVPDLVAKLRSRAGEAPTDLIVIDHAKDEGLSRFALDPVQVQHMGFRSVISPDRTKAQAVWSVAFEDLKPETLEIDHRRMVQQIYGQVEVKAQGM